MSGSMYDLYVTTYSPEGRILQIQYANTCVQNSELLSLIRTILGIKCKDGIILAAQKQLFSKLLIQGTNRRVYNIQESIGIVIGGMIPDGRDMISQARKQADNYYRTFDIPITGKVCKTKKILAQRLSLTANTYTLFNKYRPYGCVEIIGSYNKFQNKFDLYMVTPSGHCYGYYACTSGKGRQMVKNQLQKRDFKSLKCIEALPYVMKMLHLSHEQTSEKKYEMQVSWICEQTGYKHMLVAKQIRNQSEEKAMKMIEQDQMG